MLYPNVFENDKKFIFSNWSKEDFVCKWGGADIVIKTGETKELEMAIAFHLTKHFVDREMNRDKKSHLLGIEEERKQYEDKTIAEILGATDSPAMATLKEQIRKENENVSPKKVSKKEKSGPKEFEDIK